MTVGFPLISLDSLVRIETSQWVTWRKPSKVFVGASRRFKRRCGSLRLRPPGGRIVHRAGLTRFLIFCNILSLEQLATSVRIRGQLAPSLRRGDDLTI